MTFTCAGCLDRFAGEPIEYDTFLGTVNLCADCFEDDDPTPVMGTFGMDRRAGQKEERA